MGLFIYSKLFELFDTLWLILKKRPVIHLHWCVRVLAQVTYLSSCRSGPRFILSI